jgi:hypothetical protein
MVAALTRYLEMCRSVIGATEGPGGHSMESGLDAALDELCFTLEVDIAARSAASEHSEMSELEALQFRPLLERLNGRLSPLKSSVPSSTWLQPLRAAERDLGFALRQLTSPSASDPVADDFPTAAAESQQ